jgi:hypothetical protein
MLSGKLKGMGGSAEKKTIRTWLHLLMMSTLVGYSAVVFNLTMLQSLKRAYSSVTPWVEVEIGEV